MSDMADYYGIEASGYERNESTVPCGICGNPTRMLITRRCDRCWELESRIKSDPELARKILADLAPVKPNNFWSDRVCG